jgi:hypothetical protein
MPEEQFKALFQVKQLQFEIMFSRIAQEFLQKMSLSGGFG